MESAGAGFSDAGEMVLTELADLSDVGVLDPSLGGDHERDLEDSATIFSSTAAGDGLSGREDDLDCTPTGPGTGGLGGSNIFSSAKAAKMSFWNGFLGNAFPWLSSPSLTANVPATATVGPATVAGSSRSRASPSDPDADVGGESIPLAERMYGFDGERPYSGILAEDPFRDGGNGRAAPCPNDRNDPLLVCTAAGGGASGEAGGEGEASTHSSPSSSVCHAGVDAMLDK